MDREVFLALWIVIFGLLGLYLMGKLKFQSDLVNGEDKPMPVPLYHAWNGVVSICCLYDTWSMGAPTRLSVLLLTNEYAGFNLNRMRVHARYTDYEGDGGCRC